MSNKRFFWESNELSVKNKKDNVDKTPGIISIDKVKQATPDVIGNTQALISNTKRVK